MVTSIGSILTAIDRQGELARHRIAEVTELTRATVSKAVRPLLDKGVVIETERGLGSNRGGPRPILLTINPTALSFIGLDIRREKFTGTLIDLTGKTIATRSRSLPMGAPTDMLLATIDSILDELEAAAPSRVAGIGIGSVGPILPHEGKIRSYNFTALNGVPLVERLTRARGVKVDLQIGAVAAAHGEERLTATPHSVTRSVAFVVIDYAGIGLGLTSGGEGWITDHGGVGELGHVSIDRDGRPCTCGRKGCLIQYASGRALLQSLNLDHEGDAGAALAHVSDHADAGDRTVQEALLQAGEYLGYGLVDADRLLRPERLVVGTSHDHMADWYLKGISRYVDTLPDTPGERPLRARLHLATMGSSAIAYGAAALQLKNFLRAPDRTLERMPAAAATLAREGDRQGQLQAPG